MVMPAFESFRLNQEGHEVFYGVQGWEERDDPFALIRKVVGTTDGAGLTIGIGEQMWSVFLLGMQAILPKATHVSASSVLAPLRAVKDAAEIESLLELGRRMDRVFAEVRSLSFAGRTELAVGDDIFQIVKRHGLMPTQPGGVASGPNTASAQHQSVDRPIRQGDAIWVELGQGGSYNGYKADITRCFFVGPRPPEYERVYAVVKEAQETAFQATRPGVQCQAIDRAGRAIIAQAGYGSYFVHRIGHGLGLDTHEPPYMAEGNATPLVAGMVFSDEPGIYIPGQFGVRVEDVLVVTPTGARRLYACTRDCVEVY
jgi:Xaa-Pro aminopeptidase